MKQKKSKPDAQTALPRAVRRRTGKLHAHALYECRVCEGDTDGKRAYCVYYPELMCDEENAVLFNRFCKTVSERFFLFARKKAAATQKPFCAVCMMQVRNPSEKFFELHLHSYFGNPDAPSYIRDKTLYISLPEFEFRNPRDLTK